MSNEQEMRERDERLNKLSIERTHKLHGFAYDDAMLVLRHVESFDQALMQG